MNLNNTLAWPSTVLAVLLTGKARVPGAKSLSSVSPPANLGAGLCDLCQQLRLSPLPLSPGSWVVCGASQEVPNSSYWVPLGLSVTSGLVDLVTSLGASWLAPATHTVNSSSILTSFYGICGRLPFMPRISKLIEFFSLSLLEPCSNLVFTVVYLSVRRWGITQFLASLDSSAEEWSTGEPRTWRELAMCPADLVAILKPCLF